MAKGTREILDAYRLFGAAQQTDAIPNVFNTNKSKALQRDVNFDPSAYKYVPNASAYDDPERLASMNVDMQPVNEVIKNASIQFGANAVSAFGQGLANTFDLLSNAKTVKAMATGSDDDFNSHLFGLSTRDMQEWANGIAERHEILEKDPGAFDLTDIGWWGKQLASAGTGIGMGVEALAETAAIEFITGGLGTAAAISRLGKLVKNIATGAKGINKLNEALQVVKGLRSAATIYGGLNRLNESRMEANNNHDDIVATLSRQKNENGTPKYTKEEIEHLASEGARRDYYWNLALLPLDILSYRTMVFNPISGSATGLVEKGLAKVAGVFGKSTLGKTTGWAVEKGIGANIEGLEEGFQAVGSDEGKHYAEVLGGLDDGKNFAQRFVADVKSDDFWNNYAGGVLGSPVIAGVMGAVNKITTGNRAAKTEAEHKNYIKEVGIMNSAMATDIAQLQKDGKTEEADIKRRNYAAYDTLSRLHLDAAVDKTTAFDSKLTFLEATLGELNEGKTDALKDLGYNIDAQASPEVITKIKEDFKNYIADTKSMKSIYDNVKDRYNKNLVPTVTYDHFRLQQLENQSAELDATISKEKAKLSEYGKLSPQGKQIHDIDYQVQAFSEERARLTTLYSKTKNNLEKENINKLIEANKNKLSDARKQLSEVQSDETYTEQQKETDNDILNSKLHSEPYVQAVYNKENLDNTIALQRKNVALWNNPKYVKDKTLESIPKAKTKQQVRNNVEAVAIQDQNVEPEVLQAAQQKETQIEADNAAEEAPLQQPMGNANLFDDEQHGFADDIINSINVTDIPEVKPDEIIASLAPSVFDFEKSPEEAKLKVKNGVAGLLYRMGEDASFEDLIRNFAAAKGLDQADKTYEALKYGWKANNKELSDEEANSIYSKIFGDPNDEIMAGVSQLIVKDSTELKVATGIVLGQVIADQQEPDGFDTNGQPIYTYTGRVTNEASPKMAFITRLSELIKTTLEDGTIEVNYEYTSDELNTGDYVESLQLLDPDKFTENTEMEARVPTNYLDIKIPMYLANGMKGTPITFGQLVASKNLSPTDQEYKDKIPMILYKKGAKTGEKGVAFVHDIGWYHPLRFNQEKQDDMKNAIANTRSVREEVLSTNGATPITITGKRQTTFAGLIDKANASGSNNITLREANPQTKLTIYTNGQYKDSRARDSRLFPNDETKLINDPNKPFTSGQILEIRRYGLEGDKKTFVALPIFRSKIDEAAKTSIYQAMLIYADGKNPAHKQAIDHIKKDMGLDISTTVGIANYMKHFINVFEPEKNGSSKEIEQSAKNQLAPRTPYIAFQQGGNIVFGQAGVTLYVDENKKNLAVAQYIKQGLSNEDALTKATEEAKVNSRFINTARPDLAARQLGFIKTTTRVNEREGNKTKETIYPDLLSWYENNLSIDNYPANKPVITIDKNNTTTKTADTYHDYLIDRLKTNVKSHNIGTEEKPNYVTNIQPIITYDTNKNLASKIDVKEEEIKVEEPIIIPQDTKSEEDKQKIQDILKRAREKLGEDRGRSNENNMSPNVLSDEQVNTIAEDIDNIAGLDPIEQTAVTNFIFNEILGRVNFDSGAVTRESIDKEIDSLLKQGLKEERKDSQDELTTLEDLVKLDPSLVESEAGIVQMINDFKLKITKIDNIANNIEGFKRLAFTKINKYTGITESKQLLEIEEGENEYADKDSENPTDFWTDVLTESPENKVTYAIRRFFGEVRRYDKSGKPVQGFLNLPLYTDSSEIIRNMMVNLADVPSDFDTMISKLETLKEKYPWMQAAIDKLKDTKLSQQRKYQFVTVMSNTKLRMKFSMLGFNRFTNSWDVKLMDTALNGISDMLKKSWKVNLFGDSDFNLLLLNEEGKYYLNDKKAEMLMHRFESWLGLNVKTIQSDLDPIRSTVANVGSKTATIAPTGNLLNELRTNIVRKGDRMQFSMYNRDFQVTSIGNDRYEVAPLTKSTPSKEETTSWLQEFGITLSPKTVEVLLKDGLYHNYEQRKPSDLLDVGAKTNGLFGIMYNKLKALSNFEGEFDFTTYGDSPLDNSVVTSLANLEAQYNNSETPFGFRVNGKTYFALTSSKFITDRARDLKSKDSDIRRQLRQISFSKGSFWLDLLDDKEFMEHSFDVTHDGAETVKQTGKKSYRDRAGITDMSEMDHEIAKLSKFQVYTQGGVIYGKSGSKNYPGTSIPLRMSTMAGLTSSDKSIMMNVTTAVLDIQSSGLDSDIIKAIYEQTVRPELARMVKAAKNKPTNISSYNEGASLFYMIPELNNLMYSDNLRLIDAIKNRPNEFDENFIENNEILKEAINKTITDHVTKLVDDKVQAWDKANFLVKKENGTIDQIKFMDGKYLNKFKGTNEEKLKLAALDYEVNTLIANANNFMLFAGDPALYFKSKSTDNIQKVKDTFVNITKRLANQIAPGVTLANSKGEKYIQLFLEDRISTSENIDYLRKLYGEEGAKPYENIKGADAQEYTTWKEHLDVLTKLGKTADFLTDITPQEIDIARELMTSGKDLTKEQLEILRKVMQPLKPVYTGQKYEPEQDVMRTIYIKSSSFPLIPQLTKGFEIDKLRLKMEEIEKKQKLNVRASHQTANKVGSVNNASKIWGDDGNINEDALNKITESQLILDRDNFKIQQEVPYKSDKSKTDTITLGTQLMKLLFGDNVMSAKGFMLDGKEYDGKALHEEYTKAFVDLINEKQTQLFNELGLDKQGKPIDEKETKNKLQKLLEDEAIKRNYPLQDIKGLKIGEDGNFNMPLWSSTNSNRYESMLNSIVSHRMVGIKLPGSSYVTGSEEGFRTNNLPIINTEDITSYEGTKGAAQYSNGIIKVNRKLLQQKFEEKAWTTPRKLIETLHGNIIESFAESLPENKFESYAEWETFVINHEYNHSLYTRADFNKDHPNGTKGEYETIINNRALSNKYNYNDKNKTEDQLTKQERSDIIFTSAWNGTSLQASSDGKMAQVFMPSKFRDNEGKIVDLLAEKGKYTEEKDGKLMLKEDMFDKELLSSLSFRIPTSGHQSGTRIEIAGFLPHTMGDLIIVPRNFTTQKGLDFDIDKENTYMLWHTMNKDGKFEVLDDKHRTEALDKANKIKDIDNESVTKMLGIKMDLGADYHQDEIDSEPRLRNANSTFNEKLLHNKIIKISRSVYDNPSTEIQSKINKTLGTEYAEQQASMINDLIQANKSDDIFSPLSSEYQKQAMLIGASGKIGTGAYSLDVVFHSLAQQLANTGKPVTLKVNLTEDDFLGAAHIQDTFINPKEEKIWDFGGKKSTGILGQTDTIDGSRSNAAVLAERQNIAVDNASLQVMGKVNLNDLTLDVDKVFTLLGIDKGEDGNSIPFLFLSQPIIRDYVAQMKNANSIMADFTNNKEEVIVNKLLEQYDPKAENTDDEYWGEQMTNANFIAALSTKTPDGALQGAILRRFIEMKKYGAAIRGIQTAINFKNNSLGKSFFDVIERRNALNKLAYSSKIKENDKVVGTIEGAFGLIGDYISTEEIPFLDNPDYINIGDFWVKPTTVMGAFNIQATTTAYNLWNQHFPYDTDVMQNIFDQLMPITGGTGDISSTRTIEIKQDIFKHIKKYLSSSNKNGIVSSEDNVNRERERLYIDSDTNTSLAKYIKALRQINGNPIIERFIKTNKLLNSFEYNLNKDGTPSTIKYNNAAGEEFDEQFLYEALSTMIVNGKLELPEIGNKKYTLGTLAQDLIAYSFLGNSTQEAVQFTKYVPISYLNSIGYSRWLKNNLESSLGLVSNTFIPENRKHLINEFSMQYVQHNPDKVKYKLDDKNWNSKTVEPEFEGNKKDLDSLKSFKILDKTNSTFVAIYNPFRPKNDKQQLYWFDGEKYTRVPTLGTFGMDEYQLGQGIGQSIINGKVKVDVSPQPKINDIGNNNIENDPFNVESKSLSTVLDNISKSNISGLAELATAITPFIGSTTIDYAISVAGKSNWNGIYLHNEDAIYIQQKPKVKISYEAKARIILEEILHSLTINQIKPYITSNADGTVDVKSNAPSYVTNIVRLYNDVRSKSDQGELKDMLDRMDKREGITLNQLKNTYGLKDIYEFIAHSAGNKEFQKYLSRNEFKQSGQTLIGRFIEVVKDILNKLGAKFDSDTAAAHAINSVFELIENENKPDVTGRFDKFNDISDDDAADFAASNFSPSINIDFENALSNDRTRTTDISRIILKIDKAFDNLSENKVSRRQTKAWKSIEDNGYFKYETAGQIIKSLSNSRFIDFLNHFNLRDDVDKMVSRYIHTVSIENIIKPIMDMKPYIRQLEDFTNYTSKLSDTNTYGAKDWIDTRKDFPNKTLNIQEEKCI